LGGGRWLARLRAFIAQPLNGNVSDHLFELPPFAVFVVGVAGSFCVKSMGQIVKSSPYGKIIELDGGLGCEGTIDGTSDGDPL